MLDMMIRVMSITMSKSNQFEKSLQELQTIIAQLEKGELSLEESLKQFEKGVHLSRTCHEILQTAEQKVQMLTAAKSKSIEPQDE